MSQILHVDDVIKSFGPARSRVSILNEDFTILPILETATTAIDTDAATLSTYGGTLTAVTNLVSPGDINQTVTLTNTLITAATAVWVRGENVAASSALAVNVTPGSGSAVIELSNVETTAIGASANIRFTLNPQVPRNVFTITYVNGTSDTPTFAVCARNTTTRSLINLVTTAADNSIVILDGTKNPSLAVLTTDQPIFETYVVTPADLTRVEMWIGLKTAAVFTAVNGDAAIVISNDSASAATVWSYQVNAAAGDVTTTAIAASTGYHIKISVDSSRIPTFYINNVLVATGAALTDATTVYPVIGVRNYTTSSRTLSVGYVNLDVAV